jgi:DNA-binding helix-hairpin-helix protein with protein kinase domain
MALLRPGQTFPASFYSRQRVEVIGPLESGASGAQAELFAASWNGGLYALKWYHPWYRSKDTNLRERLSMLIERGTPSAYFCWPEDLVEGDQGLGYLMPKAPPAFTKLAFLLGGSVSSTYRSALTGGLLFADNMRTLHTAGLCYRDISAGNLLYHSASGDIRIVDNDNVSPDNTVGPMKGTPEYMPPEVVMGQAYASSFSDLHAFAVLLFQLLVRQHPLLGSFQDEPMFIGMDEEKRNRILMAEKARFIFDPHDCGNAPDPEVDGRAIRLWDALPTFIRKTFTVAFTKGLKDPVNGRIRETKWIQDLARMADLLFLCPACKTELFYDPERIQAEGKLGPCWHCGVRPGNPPVLNIKGYVVALGEGSLLYPHRLRGTISIPFAAAAGEVSGGALRNRTGYKWWVALLTGESGFLDPGESLPVSDLARISFGEMFGEVTVDVQH